MEEFNRLQQSMIQSFIDKKTRKTNLDLVIDFQKTCSHTVKNTSDEYIPSIEERKLRLDLILEELEEQAKSYGLEKYFVDIKDKQSLLKEEEFVNKGEELTDTHEFNQEEALDANCDLEVVVLGAYCINGFADIAREAFIETMNSNMSKFCKTEDEALATVAGKDDVVYRIVNGLYVFFKKSNNKIVKGINFFTPKYKDLLNRYKNKSV